ncbi:MAG: mandelate racemase/muconate lactonizing enzyme family protein [Vicinamibacterales bacterium]|jgi:galactonate dehydratase|nr:mandelate racemase/muconate lactonizing enzyme family protein [Vicinamibacterales bacterium]MDP7480964.1 mandelate racemase/muconate lactonizing enzyme family protein [Vicinamibacterales bacterium]MDP7691498.1 mandelate racemase/muconate lactonizing enzyme family protein [Vicinamibacterales bacterium]HJN44995.1 mandelate racemase/muconate lactonizing enzyme family protein [Vicinamibacterales bacterium]
MFLQALPLLSVAPSLAASAPATAAILQRGVAASRGLRISSMELIVVRATMRTTWLFVRLSTNQGLTGLGEASLGRRTEFPELEPFFELVRDESPFQIEQYRQRGWDRASSGDRVSATAFSALEQAQWDLVGKALGAPVCDLFGGRLRDALPVYANINRATANRMPDGFAANARAAAEEEFDAIKAAPFDGFPALTQPATEVAAAADLGVACVAAMREAVGPDVAIKIDAHSNFDVPLSIDVARRLEPHRLSWYEEPIPPQQVDDTKTIHDAIEQRMAGGEFLFGMEGFAPLCEQRAVDVVMPDVKHCGGLAEARRIAAVADLYGVAVSPHNPSGPVATAASVQLCAAMSNFDILEFQWGEVPWRGDLIDPPELFENGQIRVPDAPGFGVELNEIVVREHA